MSRYVTEDDVKMNRADDRQQEKCVDSLLNFETVKYYGNENYEVEMYEKTIIENHVRLLIFWDYILHPRTLFSPRFRLVETNADLLCVELTNFLP